MAISARMIAERVVRAIEQDANDTMDGNRTGNPFFQNASNRTGPGGNSTFNLISNLVFAESKSVRTSTIILATFNILAAFATACSILYDCYWASKRCNPKFKASKFCISSIHPAETFPLVLTIGIVIQGLAFAGVQGQGLDSLFATGCNLIAQFMWPAIFIVPYIQLVFGTECALRSFRSTPFQARGRWDVTICCGVIVVMLIATWVPSHIQPAPNACFASLIWFISSFGKLGFVMLTSVGGLMIIAALTIFIRLSTVNLIDQHQRIAASRMVYYLVLGIIPLSFVVPFFYSLIDSQGDIKLAMMATVVVNLSGLMTGLLQLFLRSNTATTSFAPKAAAKKWAEPRHQIRMFGPNEVAMHAHLVNPVTGPGTASEDRTSRSDSRASLVGLEKDRGISMESLRSQSYGGAKRQEAEMGSLPILPETARASDCPAVQARSHAQKPSYSLFPAEGSSPTKAGKKLDSVYDINQLTPPPAILYPTAPRHRRDSSITSSATVQIGLRLSHAPTPSQEDLESLPLPPTTYKAMALKPSAARSPSPSSIYSIGPLQSTTYSASKDSTPASKSSAKPTIASRMLKVQTSFIASTGQKPLPSPLNISTPQQSPASINKTLPPTPRVFLSQVGKMRDSNTQLSPTVYSLSAAVYTPEGKTSSPTPNKSNGNPFRPNPPGSPVAGPARQASSQQKRDWI
ncbi:uncharacterized protein RCO7_10388 [Rhynchosporium graminicola]|uniref:Uncharacterized protein n=1 Tax=Rhynchosporium graminicola TaxID=2792576 RepID=A0A1E1L7M2_9HELO|nr:uncharacterized protein RCO7_10388 [Rhynchosporium commune]